MTVRGLLLLPVAALVLVLVAGCGGGPEIVRVTGKVTRGGKPVPGLVVNFVPEKGYRSVGKTDGEGHFTMLYLTGQEGVAIGKHKVWVALAPSGTKDDADQPRGATLTPRNPDTLALLRKYGSVDTTPIQREITTAQVIDLPLD
jgi:hypothetical protein